MKKKMISIILLVTFILSVSTIAFAADHDDPYSKPGIIEICGR